MTRQTFKTINPLLKRVVVFLAFFVAFTGIMGPRVISGGILFRDGFALYGGIGKALIFGLIAFLLLVRHNKTAFTLRPWQSYQVMWLVAALAAFGIAWVGVDALLAGQQTALTIIEAHGGLLLSLVFAIIGSIGLKNIYLLWHTYQHELRYAAMFTVGFYIFLFAVYALWEPLASIVLFSVNWLLNLSNLHAVVVPPNTLVFDKFGVTVSEYCSGVESIALFTSLYALVGLLDWKRLNRRRFFGVFPLALLLLFLLNILRVYGLIVAGYFIDPEIAFSLFHTYAGLLFFVLYSAAFWAIAYKYLLRKKPTDKKEDPA